MQRQRLAEQSLDRITPLGRFRPAKEHVGWPISLSSVALMTVPRQDPYVICVQRRPWSACAFAQADPGLRCPLTQSADNIVYADEQKMSRLGCTDEHADLHLRCQQNGRETFAMLCIIFLVQLLFFCPSSFRLLFVWNATLCCRFLWLKTRQLTRDGLRSAV